MTRFAQFFFPSKHCWLAAIKSRCNCLLTAISFCSHQWATKLYRTSVHRRNRNYLSLILCEKLDKLNENSSITNWSANNYCWKKLLRWRKGAGKPSTMLNIPLNIIICDVQFLDEIGQSHFFEGLYSSFLCSCNIFKVEKDLLIQSQKDAKRNYSRKRMYQKYLSELYSIFYANKFLKVKFVVGSERIWNKWFVITLRVYMLVSHGWS